MPYQLGFSLEFRIIKNHEREQACMKSGFSSASENLKVHILQNKRRRR